MCGYWLRNAGERADTKLWSICQQTEGGPGKGTNRNSQYGVFPLVFLNCETRLLRRATLVLRQAPGMGQRFTNAPWPGVVVRTSNPNTLQTEAGRLSLL